jgi:segregation and condensation protein B
VSEPPPEERTPISWEALAAELAASRTAAAERGEGLGDDEPGAWDSVAADLAARVAERPVPVEEPPPLAVLADEPAAAEAEPEPEPEPEPVEELLLPLDPDALRGGLEALLFVMDDPVDEATLASALHCPVDQVSAGLPELAGDYDRRRAGIALRRVGEGWRL